MKRLNKILEHTFSILGGMIFGMLITFSMIIILDINNRNTPDYKKGYSRGYYDGYNDIITTIDSVSKYKKTYYNHPQLYGK